MISSELPAVARRRVRLALRKLRESNGLTQGQVATALEWSLSKVNRIEGGDVSVSGTDLQALLRLFGVTDDDVIRQLTEATRAARRRGWWDEPGHREHLTLSTRRLLQFESEASRMQVFQATLVPGLMQTPDYASAVVNFWGEELSEADRAARIHLRLRRGRQVFERADPPEYSLVLDESVLFREVGGAAVMSAQLTALIELSRNPRIHVRVLPLSNAAHLAMVGPFTIIDLGDDEDAVLYQEADLIDEIVESRQKVRRYRQIFGQMTERSLDGDASLRLIAARAAAMLSALDRR